MHYATRTFSFSQFPSVWKWAKGFFSFREKNFLCNFNFGMANEQKSNSEQAFPWGMLHCDEPLMSEEIYLSPELVERKRRAGRPSVQTSPTSPEVVSHTTSSRMTSNTCKLLLAYFVLELVRKWSSSSSSGFNVSGCVCDTGRERGEEREAAISQLMCVLDVFWKLFLGTFGKRPLNENERKHLVALVWFDYGVLRPLHGWAATWGESGALKETAMMLQCEWYSVVAQKRLQAIHCIARGRGATRRPRLFLLWVDTSTVVLIETLQSHPHLAFIKWKFHT